MGPITWQTVADVLRHRGVQVVVPTLPHAEDGPPPYWGRHAVAIAEAIAAAGLERPPVMVGHSGAGPLLPAVRASLEGKVRGYVFVDSRLPRHGASRLDLLDDQRAAALFRAAANDRLLLTWSYEELRGVIPDDALRRRFVQQLAPPPLPVYEEPLPVFDAWPDAPCAYLRLSAVYEETAEEARRARWPTIDLDADHYHMLVDPIAVASALLRLVRTWDRWADAGRRAPGRPATHPLDAEEALDTMVSPFRRSKR